MLRSVIFCQACGAQNAQDARFCNMCGTPIAKVGTPGGPIEHTQLGVGLTRSSLEGSSADVPAPRASQPGGSHPGGGNTMSVQLDAIGIRSTKKTWATLGGVALLLFALGGVVTFFSMGGAHEETGGAAADDPFELGSPEIQNADDVDFVSGGREGRSGAPDASTTAPSTPTGTTPPTPSTTTPTPTGTTTPSTAMSSSGTSPTTMETTSPTAMETTPSTMATTMETAPTDTTMEATPPDPGEVPPDSDMELEMYTSRVRYLVRRYYLARSQSCFEHATRNNPSLHGQVVISLTIGASGTVTASSVARNSTGDTSLGSCLATQVRSWQLTPPPGGEPISMTLPFSR